MFTYLKEDCQQNKQLSSKNYRSHPLLGLRTINTCKKLGSMNKWAHQNFFAVVKQEKVCAIFGGDASSDWFSPRQNIDSLKLCCWIPNMKSICLNKFTDSNFYPVTEADEILLEKVRDHVVCGFSIVLTRKPVVDESFLQKTTTYANQLLELMPANYTPIWCVNPCPLVFIRVGISIHEPVVSHPDKTSFEKIVMNFFQRTRPDCKIDNFYTTGTQKKIDCFSVAGFCSHCNTVSKAMGCFYHFCLCQELRPSLSEEVNKRDSKNRELTRFVETTLYTGKKLHCYRNAGAWMVETA